MWAGLASQVPRVSLEILCKLSKVRSYRVTRVGCAEFSRPVQFQIWPYGEGLNTGIVMTVLPVSYT